MPFAETMPSAVHVLDAEAVPIPPRYWWLNRLTAGGAVLMFLLVLVRLWWGWSAYGRLQAEIDRLIAAGEPIRAEDFYSPPVPDEENAAVMLREAAGILVLTDGEQNLIMNAALGSALQLEELQILGRIMESHAAVFPLVNRARKSRGVDWGIHLTSAASDTLLPDLASQRQLTKVLVASAYLKFTSGDQVGFLEQSLVALAQVRALDAQGFFVSHLVARAGEALIVNLLERCAAVVAPADAVALLDLRPAGRDQFLPLILELLEENSRRDRFIRALQDDPRSVLDMIQSIANGKVSLFAMKRNIWGVTPSSILKPSTWTVPPPTRAERAELLLWKPLLWIEAADCTTAPHGPTLARKLLKTQELRFFSGHGARRPTRARGVSP